MSLSGNVKVTTDVQIHSSRNSNTRKTSVKFMSIRARGARCPDVEVARVEDDELVSFPHDVVGNERSKTTAFLLEIDTPSHAGVLEVQNVTLCRVNAGS